MVATTLNSPSQRVDADEHRAAHDLLGHSVLEPPTILKRLQASGGYAGELVLEKCELEREGVFRSSVGGLHMQNESGVRKIVSATMRNGSWPIRESKGSDSPLRSLS